VAILSESDGISRTSSFWFPLLDFAEGTLGSFVFGANDFLSTSPVMNDMSRTGEAIIKRMSCNAMYTVCGMMPSELTIK